MQVEKEKSPRFFSNLNFAKIFYLPPISCRGEVGEILSTVRCAVSRNTILTPEGRKLHKWNGAAAEWNDFTSE